MDLAFDAILFDVGGTLWPDVLEESEASRVSRLTSALGGHRLDHADEVLRDLESAADRMIGEGGRCGMTEIHGLIGDVLRGHDLDDSPEVIDAVRRAMVTPAEEGLLFPGAVELLSATERLGLASGAVSNSVWRDTSDYRSDFDRLGLAGHFAVIVASIDAGVRKPHPGIFRQALDGLATSGERSIFVGNDEAADIEPARELGMRTIRVAIEEPRPAFTQAHLSVGSLSEAREAIEVLMVA